MTMPKQKKVVEPVEPIDQSMNRLQLAGAIMVARQTVTALEHSSDPKRLEYAKKHLERLLKVEQESGEE
jgi:DNA-binding XRE family transcriptional regulator